jgi:hypothetical protein
VTAPAQRAASNHLPVFARINMPPFAGARRRLANILAVNFDVRKYKYLGMIRMYVFSGFRDVKRAKAAAEGDLLLNLICRSRKSRI